MRALTVSYLGVLLICGGCTETNFQGDTSSQFYGKTVQFEIQTRACDPNRVGRCTSWRKVNSKVYFSKDGKIFVYFNNSKKVGVVIEKGSTSASRNNKSMNATETASVRHSKNNIYTKYSVAFYDRKSKGYSQHTDVSISFSGSKCRISKLNLWHSGGPSKIDLLSRPIYCKIYDGH